MFNVKIKVKEGNNTLPRSKQRTGSIMSTASGGGGGGYSTTGRNSPANSSLRSSLASSNRSPNNSLKRKDKRVRIVTTYMPNDDLQYQQQQQQQLQQRVRQHYGKDTKHDCCLHTTMWLKGTWREGQQKKVMSLPNCLCTC